MAFHRVLISEQIIAQVQESLFHVTSVEVLRRDTIVCEFPDILREAATEIEKRVLRFRVFETGKDTRVARLKGY